MDDPTIEVRRLLIEGQGISSSKVLPSARIVHDLGVDGDDAAELIDALRLHFGTDFSALEGQWSTFFNVEGISLKAFLISIPVLVIVAGGAGALAARYRWPTIAAVAGTLVLLLVLSRLYGRWFGTNLTPVTVGGLAEIVKSGHWPSDPANVR